MAHRHASPSSENGSPDASAALDWLIITLSLIAVVYIGFVALVQQDMKKLIAYSSISHMGFVTLGMFIAFGVFQNTESGRGAALGVEGAMVQMISHGFISGAMFLCVGVLYDRVHSRMIKDYGGVANKIRGSPPSRYCSSWPTRACRAPADSSVNSW